MTASPSPNSSVQVRAYRREDEPHVVGLLQTAFGKWPRGIEDQDPTELFRWKHIANAFGRSVMTVAHAEGELIGFAAWLRWRMTANDQVFEVLRGVDLAVHPAHRGQGVYPELLRRATTQFPPGAAFTLSSPNALSRPVTLRTGGRELGVFPLLVRFVARRSAVRLIGALGSSRAHDQGSPIGAESAADALGDGESVCALLSQL